MAHQYPKSSHHRSSAAPLEFLYSTIQLLLLAYLVVLTNTDCYYFQGYSRTFPWWLIKGILINPLSKSFFLIKDKIVYNNLSGLISYCFLSHFLFSIFASSEAKGLKSFLGNHSANSPQKFLQVQLVARKQMLSRR